MEGRTKNDKEDSDILNKKQQNKRQRSPIQAKGAFICLQSFV